MSPPAPARYSRGLIDRSLTWAALRRASSWWCATSCASREIARRNARDRAFRRHPRRLDVDAGSVEFMIDTAFNRADRQDATITFAGERNASAAREVSRLPGVMVAEPYRSVP
jgi:putative ABC transport system permease protein